MTVNVFIEAGIPFYSFQGSDDNIFYIDIFLFNTWANAFIDFKAKNGYFVSNSTVIITIVN
jgi:hypothetical protein